LVIFLKIIAHLIELDTKVSVVLDNISNEDATLREGGEEP